MRATPIATEVQMGEIKTQRTATSVEVIINGITDDARRQDCFALLGLMKRATGVDPEVWSSGVVGFGTYHYKSSSGQEGDWFPVGFASRKAAITVYLGLSLEEVAPQLAKLGKHKTGKGCIYIKRLADVDLTVLEELVADSYARMKQTYGVGTEIG
jgi:hypothetical protein